MVDPVTARTWGYRLLFTLLILSLAFAQLLPLGMGAGRLPGPDLTVALTFAWVLRRPAYVPVPLLFALFLFLDLLLQHPPGLWAALVLTGAEMLRSRREMSRNLPFAAEWLMVAVAVLLITGLNQIALTLVMLDAPPLGLALLRAVFTAAAYPLVVVLSHYAFGVSRADPKEAAALGSRL